VKVLTERGVVEVIGLCGYYTMVSMTLNTFEFGCPRVKSPTCVRDARCIDSRSARSMHWRQHAPKSTCHCRYADRACSSQGRRSRRALGFYCGVLGFEVMQRMGDSAAFISAGGYHHHIGLNTWESKGGHPPPPGATGLFHTAILYPSRPALADALHRVMQAGIQLERRQRPRRQRGALLARSRTRTVSNSIGTGRRRMAARG